ncbi:cobalamin biosynthesis protein CbiX [Maribrevibacterium harenarium]|uniref:Cobalamin biosynthesis protein CbiX n=1 Tax=Maribrevibacterium harenarium TaxID=2589817 RepID=A0A501X554_9GAMM|nr:CbiX/SirB N-terminal domain-containing protein [Maribrevibacterium harenarium]TPE55537.1 cobalamin biosynthesis protein CbiX [Maribrevibacterium harenarium]
MNLSHFDHVILLAHGSPASSWKAPFEALLDDVQAQVGREKVSLAYMELTTPSLEQVAASLSDSVKTIAVYPIFFAVGRHLREDVPKQLMQLNSDQRQFTLLEPIGSDPVVKAALSRAITSKLTG